MADNQAVATRNEAAHIELRNDILAGRLRPGQRLPFADLCRSYGVSVGVIREALARLVEQGLVQTEPQKGFFVTAISKPDLMNLTTARCEIESLTLRHAIQTGDVQWESEVLAAHHRLANAPLEQADDPGRLSEDWVEAHRTFHETLLAGCANPRLTRIATDLRASAELYRRWSVPLDHDAHPRDIPAEHAAILGAVLQRDADTATQLLVEHISLTTDLLLSAGVVSEDDEQSPAASRKRSRKPRDA